MKAIDLLHEYNEQFPLRVRAFVGEFDYGLKGGRALELTSPTGIVHRGAVYWWKDNPVGPAVADQVIAEKWARKLKRWLR